MFIGFMTKYCVTFPEEKPRHPHDTLAALLDIDKTLAPLRLFESVREAVDAAQYHKRAEKGDPYLVCEVREYHGTNGLMPEIEKHGRWNLGPILRWV